MTRRHLSEIEIQQALIRGKSVAQFLGRVVREPFGDIVRWLSIHKGRDEQHVVTLYEASDVGRDDFVDIVEFPSIHGDDQLSATFSSLEEALSYAIENLGAVRERFVNSSVIGDEYADLRRRGP